MPATQGLCLYHAEKDEETGLSHGRVDGTQKSSWIIFKAAMNNIPADQSLRSSSGKGTIPEAKLLEYEAAAAKQNNDGHSDSN